MAWSSQTRTEQLSPPANAYFSSFRHHVASDEIWHLPHEPPLIPATPILIAETHRNRLAKVAVAQNENHTKQCKYAILHSTTIIVFMTKILEITFYTIDPITMLILYVKNTLFAEKSLSKANCGYRKRRNCQIVWTHMWLPEKELSTKLICLSWIMEVNERFYTQWSGPIIEKRQGQKSTNPSLVLPPLFLGSWSRFSAVKSHENPTPTRNYLMSEPVIYPFIELPISIEWRTLTSDDFLVDKCEEINVIILLQ